MIFTARVTSGQEKIIAEILTKKARAEEPNIYSIVYVDSIKGYLFIEGQEENSVVKLIQKVKHVKGLLPKVTPLNELEKHIKATAKPAVVIEVKDIVEIASGAFKGERAKVLRVDEAKDEITVELLEVTVPIPVSVKTKTVKLFKKAEE
ncbi:MAG TPA: transcription elongation factor Spt5 [Candidatus Bilamarchaeaceae archaeon]|nr:transcription elongation factor Spt5 [Candidatus Bilamarchaeaceae archaeon]